MTVGSNKVYLFDYRLMLLTLDPLVDTFLPDSPLYTANKSI